MEAHVWDTLQHGDAMVMVCGGTIPYRFRVDPVPFTSTSRSCRRYYRNYRMVGYLRARADRENGMSVRIGRMEEFRGVHDENRRQTDRCWKSFGKRKSQWM